MTAGLKSTTRSRLFLLALISALAASPPLSSAQTLTSTSQSRAAGATEVDSLDDYPEWSRNEFESAVREFIGRPGSLRITVRLLAWKVQEDDRPLLINDGLAWAQLDFGSSHLWALALMFQHPKSERMWFPVEIIDGSQWVGIQYFPHPPTNADIDKFIEFAPPEENFFEPSSGFLVLRSGIRRKTWETVIGSPPNREISHDTCPYLSWLPPLP